MHSSLYEQILEEGIEKGRVEGRLEEARSLLLMLAASQFGQRPAWLEEWAAAQTEHAKIEMAFSGLLHAKSLDAWKNTICRS